MDRIVTASGKEYPCGFFGVVAAAGILYTNVQISFPEAYQIFSDEWETHVLKYIYESNGGEEERSLRGYTTFIGAEILFNDRNELRISMRKPFADE